MIKVLFVDYLSPEGHIHSTRAQINTFLDMGYEVYTVFQEGYVERFNICGVTKYLEIPKGFYKGIGTHLRSRWSYIKILDYLKDIQITGLKENL